jgi:S1-C subfamily serine protease
MMTIVLALSAFLAQDRSQDERTKRILERVEKEIQDSHTRLLEDLRQIIRQELGKGGAPAPEAAPSGKPYLGISLDDLSDDERKTLGITGGVRIGEVRGPSEKAGLKSGDILLEMDGVAVTEESLGDLLAKHKPGESMSVKILRGKKSQTIQVVLGVRKE